jgi:hypothetical protein
MGNLLCTETISPNTKEGFSKSGKVTLHGDIMQPGTRAILVMLKTCKVEYEFKEIDVLKG